MANHGMINIETDSGNLVPDRFRAPQMTGTGGVGLVVCLTFSVSRSRGNQRSSGKSFPGPGIRARATPVLSVLSEVVAAILWFCKLVIDVDPSSVPI